MQDSAEWPIGQVSRKQIPDEGLQAKIPTIWVQPLFLLLSLHRFSSSSTPGFDVHVNNKKNTF